MIFLRITKTECLSQSINDATDSKVLTNFFSEILAILRFIFANTVI